MSEDNFLRYIIGASRTKFAVLDELFKKQYPSGMPEFKMAVIMVDAHSILTPIYRPNNEYAFNKSADEVATDVVINFMNVLGHYRRYMATRLHLDNDIFVSYNRIQPKFQKLCFPKYFEKQAYRYSEDNYKHEFANKVTNRAWTFICELSKHFEGIYCWDIPGLDDFSGLAKAGNLIHTTPDVLKIFITKNAFAQSMLVDDSSFILYPNGDASYLVSRKDAITKGLLKAFKHHPTDIEILTPEILPVLWSFAGLKDMSVGPSPFVHINGPATICKLAIRIVRDDGYDPSAVTLSKFIVALAKYCCYSEKQLYEKYPTMLRRMKLLQWIPGHAAVTAHQEAELKRAMVDLFDQNALEELNQLLADMKTDPDLFEIENLNMSTGEVYA